MQTTRLFNFDISFTHKAEFNILKEEIFTQHNYYVDLEKIDPVILDIGAHIGMSVMYFKKNYPLSQIIAIEPNPSCFKILEENIFNNRLENVELIGKALVPDSYPTQITMYQEIDGDWLSTSSIHQGAWTKEEPTSPFIATTIKLAEVFNQKFDIVKMDIEGFEEELLGKMGPYFHLIDNLFIEYHPSSDQSLLKIGELLEKHQFKVKYKKNGQYVKQHLAKGLIIIEATK